jgi:uridine kinase
VPDIIAVCGSMGSGKSTLVEQAAGALPNAVGLCEDDYNTTPNRSLDDIEEWWGRGGDVAEFDLSGLLTELQARTQGQQNGRTVDSSEPLILLETQFGRLHPELQPWITLQIWIDVPADIAFARKTAELSAQMQHSSSPIAAVDGLRWIEQFCRGYLSTTRKLFEMQRKQVREQSDVTIDGTGKPLDVFQQFLDRLPQSYKSMNQAR